MPRNVYYNPAVLCASNKIVGIARLK